MTHHFHYTSACFPLFIKQDDSPISTSGVKFFTGYLSGVDGVKTVFSTEHYFDITAVHVERNGLVQAIGDDYTAIATGTGEGTAIEFKTAPAADPEPDTLFIRYKILGNKL